jgi:hypothetical protein
MNLFKRSSLVALLMASLAPYAVGLAAGKTYQATGPVLEFTDTTITIQKGKEKWEMARTPETKVTGELKVGSKITVSYTMNAVSAEVKPEKAAKK